MGGQATSDIKELYIKLAPYILPVVLFLLIVAIFVAPFHAIKHKDVLKFKKTEPANVLCTKLSNVTNEAILGDMSVKKIGLTTEPQYPLYLAIRKTIFGYYEVRLIRCDPEGAFFPIICKVETPEGDTERVTFTQSRESLLLIYTGNFPEGINAQCEPLRFLK